MTTLHLTLDAAAAYWGVMVLRATVVLVGAMALAALSGRSSAAARHSLWTVTLCALVLLPLVQWAAPTISVPVPWLTHAATAPLTSNALSESAAPDAPTATATAADRSGRSAPATERRLANGGLSPSSGVETPPPFVAPVLVPIQEESLLRARPTAEGVGPAVGSRHDSGVTGTRPSRLPFEPAGIVLLLWLMGAAAMAAPLCVGLWRSRALRRGASPVKGSEWADSLAWAAAAAGVSRQVALYSSTSVRIAMTGGVLRPFVLLPEAAGSWSEERRRVVLLHELIHVRRADAMRQVLGRVVLSLYWFHPIAWWAVRTAALAREEACDEAVLNLGQRPSAYARHLLDLVEPGPVPLPAISLFDRPQLEKRIMRILAFQIGGRSRRFVLVAPLLAVAWSVMAAAAVPASSEGSRSVAAPVAMQPHAEAISQTFVREPHGAEAESRSPFLGLAQPDISSLFIDAERAIHPDIFSLVDAGRAIHPDIPFMSFDAVRPILPEALVMPPWIAEARLMELDGRSSRQEQADSCLAGPAGGFRTLPDGGADEQTRLLGVGGLMICFWSRGLGAAENLATRVESLPLGAEVVLATIGPQGERRMVISAGADGISHTWMVDGIERPFGPEAREWRDAMLTIVDGHAEIDHLRATETRTRMQMAAAMAEDVSRAVTPLAAQARVSADPEIQVALQEQLREAAQRQSMDTEATRAMSTLSSRIALLQMAQSATQDGVTRERLSAEIQSLQSTLRGQQEEVRLQFEESRGVRAAQVAEIASQLAQQQRVRAAESGVVREQIAATAQSLRLREAETARRIRELEVRIDEAARRLQNAQ